MTPRARADGLLWIGALLASPACGGGDMTPAQFIAPFYGEVCANTECGPHGVCAASASGEPECACEVGYRGVACEACEPGFHRDYLDRCLSDVRCAEQDENPCAPNGRCIDEAGVIACACDEGYEGPRCNLCAQEYARDELDRCLPLFLGGTGGSPPPEPPPDPPPEIECGEDSCPEHALCSVIDGEVACQCQHGLLAPDCDTCDAGYERLDGACVPLPTCMVGACPEHASCSEAMGEAVCTCDAGYAGEDCSGCAQGFHLEGEACVADASCEDDTCSDRAQCVVVEGAAQCVCEAGWGGAQCERCVDLATESTAFEFIMGWPATPNVCGSRNTELSISRLTLRSREGQGVVHLCAAGSTFHRLDTQHVELEAGPLAAQLVFWQPVVMISFDYATTINPLDLDVLADERVVDDIALEPHRMGSLTLALDPPAMTVGLRSRTGFLQNVALDNVVYHYETCR